MAFTHSQTILHECTSTKEIFGDIDWNLLYGYFLGLKSIIFHDITLCLNKVETK